MSLLRAFNKDKYIKEICYKKDKSIKITYYHQNKFKPKYLINNNHYFFSNGYRTILTSDTVNESINPLDLTSLYPVEKFQTAIESKVINDVFTDLKSSKLDLVKLLLFANIGIGAILLYYTVM
jgi:hypothetical protein